ncbi:hypothetical protein BY458DRAFT_506378 [Sporodiniella umbellata]|nr:hypothetical protein BY458DRAFT_506378 [Sporodiniella umbellata]
MGLSDSFHRFIKRNFVQPEQTETKPNKPDHPWPVYASNGFLRDPTRCGNVPDVVGYYYDPMGGNIARNQGLDPTHTGA